MGTEGFDPRWQGNLPLSTQKEHLQILSFLTGPLLTVSKAE